MNKQTKLLIFDWDGTLVNSIDRIVESLQVAAGKCQIAPPTDEAAKAIIGLSLVEAFAVLYPQLDDQQLVESFRSAYVEQYFLLEQEPSSFYPGVRDAIDNFKAQGYQLAVATGKSRRGLNYMLSKHNMHDFFDITRCADESKSKPDPLMLHQILQHCQRSAQQAIMVGDSPFDLMMAHKAEITPIAVSYGAQPVKVLQQENPLLIIDNFGQLQNWLNEQESH